MDDKTKNILAYLLDFLHEKDYDCRTNVTYITKLLYMIELYHYRRTGERLTDLTWKFWHFGPYAEEIENVKRTEHGILTTFFKFDRPSLPSKPQNNLDPQIKGDIERVIEDFAHMPLPNLLDFVYFETEPMQNAKRRGDFLDFKTIKKKEKIQLVVDKKEFMEAKKRFIKQAKRDLEMGKYTKTLPPIVIKRPYEENEDPYYSWNINKIINSEILIEDD